MAGKLKAARHRTRNRPGKYPDGDGLYLVVASATSKNWNYRYWKDGKQRWLGLGSLKDGSLKDARLARDTARLRVKGDRSTPGVDIVQEKRAAREEAKAVESKVTVPTFEECAEAYIREHWSTLSKKHRDQWPSSLKRYAYATLGKLTVPEIKPSHIYEVLQPIWVEKRETRERAHGSAENALPLVVCRRRGGCATGRLGCIKPKIDTTRCSSEKRSRLGKKATDFAAGGGEHAKAVQ
jgi:hypothetical protein